MVTIETIEYLSLTILAIVLYVYFFYWFASKNKKIDVYIQPKIFIWKIKTSLLLSGTIIILVISQPTIFFSIVGSIEILFVQSLALSLIFLPILLFLALLGFVIYPGIFVLGSAALGLVGGLVFPQLTMIYWSYTVATTMIFLSLFVSARHAVDTLILRIKEIDDFDIVYHMENNSRIGIGSFILCLLLPTALFIRFILRATKTGVVKITLSVAPSRMDRVRGEQVWAEKWTTVNLEKMSENHQEVVNRVENMEKHARRRTGRM